MNDEQIILDWLLANGYDANRVRRNRFDIEDLVLLANDYLQTKLNISTNKYISFFHDENDATQTLEQDINSYIGYKLSSILLVDHRGREGYRVILEKID